MIEAIITTTTLILIKVKTGLFCLDNVPLFQYGYPKLGIMKRISFDCIPDSAKTTLQQVGSTLSLLIHAGWKEGLIYIYKLSLKVFIV